MALFVIVYDHCGKCSIPLVQKDSFILYFLMLN